MAKATPAPAVLSGVRAALVSHAPFAAMSRETLDRVVRAARIAYFAPGEVILAPSDTRPALCYVIRQGRVRGERDPAGGQGGSRALWELGPGEMFPLAAHLARRGVTSRYRAEGDVFCLGFPADLFDQLVDASPVFQDFCTRRLYSSFFRETDHFQEVVLPACFMALTSCFIFGAGRPTSLNPQWVTGVSLHSSNSSMAFSTVRSLYVNIKMNSGSWSDSFL